MLRTSLLLIVIVFLCACSQNKSELPHIIINTNYGDIEAELYPAQAPKTVAAFLKNIDEGIYKNSTFYRVLKDDDMPTDYNTGLIQAGTWPKNNSSSPIAHEPTTMSKLTHSNGTLSMARTGLGTATTEFFICIGDKKSLDAGNKGTTDGLGYAAFGRVVDGMDVARKIQAAESNGDNFVDPIKIASIKRN